MLRRMKLSSRMMVMGLVICVCCMAVFPWIISTIKNNLYAEKEAKTKELVETTWGVVDYYSKLSKTNTMPVEEAQKKALDTIKNLRYDKSNYFWINDLVPKMIMHPMTPDMDGKDLSTYADPNGKRLFVEMADVCKKKGEGIVEYMWPKAGAKEPMPKISYVKLHRDWGWVIGSGIYVDDVQAEIWRMVYMFAAAFVAILIGGLFISYFMARSISRPVVHVIDGLNSCAGEVNGASAQVSSECQSLAEGISEQAAGLEEISSTIEETSSMIKQSANNSQQVHQLMIHTGKVVDEAKKTMSELTGAMHEITKASEATARIIKTIDEIAFQTNLLALNAAVEAARAGEAGAGFAVVADEVRNLAMRSAEAAKNTASLIEDTVSKIKNGSTIVTKTNDTFAEVTNSAQSVSVLIDEIAAASQEHAQGIDQINQTINGMSAITQRSAASAEESASAAEEMNSQTGQIKDFMHELAVLVTGKDNVKTDFSSGNRMTLKAPEALPQLAHKGVIARSVVPQIGDAKRHKRIAVHNDKFKDFE
jgi:methyl-accepting chemotaxis protein